MKLADLDRNTMYTYADYCKWTFDERVELLGGQVYDMGPTPTTTHQRLSSYLFFRCTAF
jgi:hypothetical protein